MSDLEAMPNNPPGWVKEFRNELSEINGTVKMIDKRLDELSETVEDSSKKLNDVFNELKQLKAENSNLKASNYALKREVDTLKNQFIYLEAQSRRNNLLFDGVEESGEVTWQDCENNLLNKLRECLPHITDLNFERVHRIGNKEKQIKENKPRQIVAKFNSYKQRDLVWSSRFSFQGSKIWVSEDYPPAVRANRQKLTPYLQAAKRSPEIKSSSLRLDRLYLNNKQFTVETIDQIPESLQLHNSSMISTENTVVFASKHAALSNLHVCPIKIEGQEFNSTEQYIQYSKALLFNDQASAAKILDETDTFKQMMLGKKINRFRKDTWQARVREVMVRANDAKFHQNYHAREALLRTGSKHLGEATIDPYYGIGQRLTSKTVSVKDTWEGTNVMGSVLEQIRSKLINI
jgi:ribA/ribD-fused uncharacterized protein